MQQGHLFETTLAGLLPAVRAAMRQVAHEGTLSRDEIAERMGERAMLAGVKLTQGNAKGVHKDTLEKWLNPADSGHPPSLMAVNVFVAVTGDTRPLEVMLQLHGCGLMGPEDRKLRDYGRAVVEEREARRKKRKLEGDLR